MTSICVSPAPSSQRWRPHPHQRNRGRPASSFASLHDLRLHVSTSLRSATPLHFALSIHSPSAGLCPPSPSRRHMGRLRGHGQSRALLFDTLFTATTLSPDEKTWLDRTVLTALRCLFTSAVDSLSFGRTLSTLSFSAPHGAPPRAWPFQSSALPHALHSDYTVTRHKTARSNRRCKTLTTSAPACEFDLLNRPLLSWGAVGSHSFY